MSSTSAFVLGFYVRIGGGWRNKLCMYGAGMWKFISHTFKSFPRERVSKGEGGLKEIKSLYYVFDFLVQIKSSPSRQW